MAYTARGQYDEKGLKVKKSNNIEECPVEVPVHPGGFEVGEQPNTHAKASKANLVRSTKTITFKTINITDIHLNIPLFKQFKNNKTDFTADGEHQFKELVARIKLFLTTDNGGKNFVLYIKGSASQIPTSFDPKKPNNNLLPDGRSMPGRTSVENNKLLAKARADELAKKIRHAIPGINIHTPKLEDIPLGETQWTPEVQKALNQAAIKRDKKGTEAIFEPFQKDQWVKVDCDDITNISRTPESVKMYMLSTTPSIKAKINNELQTVKTIFIVSKKTWDRVVMNRSFASVLQRDRFLKSLNLKVFQMDKDSLKRWYLLSGPQEIHAFNIKDYEERTWQMYKLGIVDDIDYSLIQEGIRQELEKLYKM
ncbi:MAG: hypothetical protein NW207_03235 [Cytophagales bacterium]|nr:hypothetical protein [Cytophagales bacterium]